MPKRGTQDIDIMLISDDHIDMVHQALSDNFKRHRREMNDKLWKDFGEYVDREVMMETLLHNARKIAELQSKTR